MRSSLAVGVVCTLLVSNPVYSGAGELPLLTLNDFQFAGAFRLPADEFGEASLNFAQGPITVNTETQTLFIVGHAHTQAVAEFHMPELVQSSVLGDLNMAAAPEQDFARVLDRVADGNPQGLDRIGGLHLVPTATGHELWINAFEYYDAPGDNTMTTMVVRDADDLAGSIVDGCFTFVGGAGHTSGWLSEIPSAWQDALGGTHLTGQSSGQPIISRLSVGPSAFAFTPSEPQPDPIPTETLLDFSLTFPLHEDLSNDTLENDLWTHLSRAAYGFIAPGTRTYVTVGSSGGHNSGVCYKCIQTDGHECGGYCPPDPSDVSLYFWLWDVDDLVEVRDGLRLPHEVVPYEYGEFPAAFPAVEMGGGFFDAETGRLYVSLLKADLEQGTYANPPVVAAYDIAPSTTHGPEAEEASDAFGALVPNPHRDTTTLRFTLEEAGRGSAAVYDARGRRVREFAERAWETGPQSLSWNGLNDEGHPVPPGVYWIRIQAGERVLVERSVRVE